MHYLRTPLAAIKGYIDLIDADNLTKKQKAYIEIINNKVSEMTTLAEQLFDYTKCLDYEKT